jgi:hypothetical protein
MGVFAAGPAGSPATSTLRRPEPACDHPPVTRRSLTAVAGFALLASTLVVLLEACSLRPAAPPSGQPATLDSTFKTVAASRTAPDWRPGDRWLYGLLIGTEHGTKIVEVLEIRDINSALFYIVRVDGLEHFYTAQLQWAGHARDRKIESRMSPPLPWFTWPLEPGRQWTYRGTLQDPSGAVERTDTFIVLGSEVVEVPAGRFNTLKIVHESDRGERNEYWYAPDVRSYIKWVGRRGSARTEEQLREYQAAPRS